MDNEEKQYSAQDIIKIEAYQQIRKCFKEWGIEGTEDKIKKVYNTDQMKALKNYMLDRYREIINGQVK